MNMHAPVLSFAHDRRLAAFGIVGFAVALAAASQIAIPLPGTPVPFTLQPMLVVLSGLMLGPTFGAASMMLFLVAGALGAPVFTPGGAPGIARLLGPTGGYLIAYPFAAFATGFVARRAPSLTGRFGAALTGMALIFLGGVAQLAALTGSAAQAIAFGVTPFALFDVAKAFLAALIARPRRAIRG
jgi:biotin transport system substrate-specific component